MNGWGLETDHTPKNGPEPASRPDGGPRVGYRAVRAPGPGGRETVGEVVGPVAGTEAVAGGQRRHVQLNIAKTETR